MGIPSLFSFLSREYDNIIINTIPYVDNLYFDLNCLIHPQCHKILSENKDWTDKNNLESLMIIQIKKYISELVKYINPNKLIYISIDGSAPLAKIKQQRDRRHMSIKEKEFISNLNKKYDKPPQKIWDTNVITPGTVFMNKLKKEISKYIKDELDFTGKIIFSSADIEGEGEHKILEYLKKNVHKEMIECVYGLDADLIMLSLASQCKNIFLLREKVEYKTHNIVQMNHNTKISNKQECNKKQEFDIVSISILKSCLIETICEKLINSYDENDIIEDFVFYCFLLGNDFVPKLPSLQIKDGSIIRLISIYSSILNNMNELLIIKGKVNTTFLLQLFENLSLIEEDTLSAYTKYNLRRNNNYHGIDQYERDKYNFENNLPKTKNNLNLGNVNYQNNYYIYYFDICYDTEKEYIDNVCKNYLNTLQWIYQYYYKKCIDWRYCYKYNISPFASDLYKYISENMDEINNLDIFDKKNQPFTSNQQLLLVLPIQSNHILSNKYKYLQTQKSPIYDMYPTSFEEFSDNNNYRWQNIPKLPDLEYERIIDIVNEKYKKSKVLIITK